VRQFLTHRTHDTHVNSLLSRAFRCVTVWVVLLLNNFIVISFNMPRPNSQFACKANLSWTVSTTERNAMPAILQVVVLQ